MSTAMPKRYCKIEVKDPQGNVRTFLNQDSLGPRIDFFVIRKTQTFQNGFSTAEIKIYNLAARGENNSFDFLKTKGLEISMICGTQGIRNGVIDQIFNGYVYTVLRTKEGPDIITILYCSTVDPENPKTALTLSKSYKQIKLRALLKEIADDMGMELVLGGNYYNDVIITKRSYAEDCKMVLDELAQTYEFNWEIRGNKLYIFKIDDNNTNTRVFEFNRSSGLLKPPIVTEKGVDIEIFLQPNINPADRFILQSEFATFNLGALQFQDRISSKISIGFIRTINDNRYTGNFQTLFLVHQGSTHTDEWKTRIEGYLQGLEAA
jgi:hypothetical protein